jgi:hypothetical protein
MKNFQEEWLILGQIHRTLWPREDQERHKNKQHTFTIYASPIQFFSTILMYYNIKAINLPVNITCIILSSSWSL